MISTIGLILDIVVVAMLVVFGIIGYKKGFLKTIISLFSWVVCIAVAILTAKYVAGWLNGIFNFSGFFGDKIASALNGVHEIFGKSVSEYGSASDIVTAIDSTKINGLLKQVVKVVFNNANISDISTVDESVSSFVGSSLGHVCMLVITAILIFIILKIAVALLSKLFDNIARTKILGGLNKILGMVLGLLKAGCIIVIFNGVLVALSLVPAVNKAITPIVQDNTHIERFIFNKTDDIVGKYIIEGNAIQDWISDLWENK